MKQLLKASLEVEMLKKRFESAMFDVYKRAKVEAKYNATAFLQMLMKDGGWLTAKKLINAPR